MQKGKAPQRQTPSNPSAEEEHNVLPKLPLGETKLGGVLTRTTSMGHGAEMLAYVSVGVRRLWRRLGRLGA